MKDVYIKCDHQYSYRRGQWARVVGVTGVNGRVCYEVEFIDGYRDQWPIMESEKYEFNFGNYASRYDWTGERVK